jgi:transcriptional regulator with XRE-family HTH domain
MWSAPSRPATLWAMAARTTTAVGKLFGSLLRDNRKKSGLSQERLAELCGCTTLSISNIERGAHRPNIALVIKLEHALGLRPGHLVAETTAALKESERRVAPRSTGPSKAHTKR